MWTGPWTYDDEARGEHLGPEARRGGPLRQRWLPAVGNSDAHSVPQVIGLPHNVVHADDLTATDALMDGLRAGRNWIAESADVGSPAASP